jgi:hypothetical protein
MTVRVLIVAIDDGQPLGPQVRAARAVLEWKTVAELAGDRYSIRHLKRIVDMSDISDRRVVRHCTMMTAPVLTVGALGNEPLFTVPRPYLDTAADAVPVVAADGAGAQHRRERGRGAGGPLARGPTGRT